MAGGRRAWGGGRARSRSGWGTATPLRPAASQGHFDNARPGFWTLTCPRGATTPLHPPPCLPGPPPTHPTPPPHTTSTPTQPGHNAPPNPPTPPLQPPLQPPPTPPPQPPLLLLQRRRAGHPPLHRGAGGRAGPPHGGGGPRRRRGQLPVRRVRGAHARAQERRVRGGAPGGRPGARGAGARGRGLWRRERHGGAWVPAKEGRA